MRLRRCSLSVFAKGACWTPRGQVGSPDSARSSTESSVTSPAASRGSGADAELIALTRKCLSPEPIDRPKDAQAVADGLSRYLDGVQERLQTAERERAVAVARAEEEVKTRQVAEEKATEQRKRRRVQAQLAASVAALVLGGVSVAWWQTEQANALKGQPWSNRRGSSPFWAKVKRSSCCGGGSYCSRR
jgi:hypothetical protein